ncbi:MAG: serine protease [Oscillospiraceae bacterium]|nr:serine protease [Oscillospiraceae bacterium]
MKKRFRTAAALAACILTCSSLMPAAVFADDTPAAQQYGDINLDQQVDVSDAVLLARFCAEDATVNISQTGKALADVDADGKITQDDTVTLLQFIAKLIPSLGPAAQVETDYKTVNLMDGIKSAEIKSKPVDAAFTDSQYALTINLLKQTAQANTKNDNLMISPLSVSLALSMTANGAKDQTLTEMEKVLGGDLKIADLNAYYADYLNTLPNSENAQLHIANSIWFKNDPLIKVPQEFLQTNADYYKADAYKAPFNEQTVKDINSWVNKNTHEMIPKLLDTIPNGNVFMYLINALAFEADWASCYKDNEIGEGEFTPYGTDPVTVEMMHGEERTYLEDEYATGFMKSYKGGGYSFAAILPKESESITVSDYIGMMTPESLQKLLSTKQNCKVITKMPKFKFAYDTELSEALKAAGMPTAFNEEKSDFGNLNAGSGNGYISRVLHKTFIQVDEAGTKAGAVTAVEMQIKSAIEVDKPKTVYLDRPFIFMIVDHQHNLPIFIGYVMNPLEE